MPALIARLLFTIRVYTFFPCVLHCRVDHICQFIFSLCFVLLPPLALEAPSDSHGSCKMKVTALFHVTIPTRRFHFHWPQTPDFLVSKNRLLQTLTLPSPSAPSTPPPPFSVYRLLLGSLTLLCPVFASMCQTKIYVPVWGTDIRILYVSRLIEGFGFLSALALIKNPKVMKPAFPQGCKPDLRTHWNVSQSHRMVSIFENDLLWSVWETASVFGHWVEPCF